MPQLDKFTYFLSLCLKTFFGMLLIRKLMGWCFQLFYYLGDSFIFNDDLLFLLILIFVFVFRRKSRFLGKKFQSIWIYFFVILFIFEIFIEEPAECAGQDGSSSSSPNPEPDENTIYWQEAVEKRIRNFLNENQLHIPRPHTIKELRAEVCGRDATKLSHALFLQNFEKKEEYQNQIVEVINRWKG